MEPRQYLRVEGLAVLVAALWAFVSLEGSLLLFVVVALAPDLSMVGYLAGPRIGARTYNAVHVYLGPLALGIAGLTVDLLLAQQVATVWIAHIGADRLAGYGLKAESGFQSTHLRRPDAPEPTGRN